METTGTEIKVVSERSRYNLAAENPDEFPDVPEFAADRYHELPARLFHELVRRTLFATDNESSRYALGGVLLVFEPDRIIAVGTDGRRLAKMEGPAQAVNGHTTGEVVTIVPTKAMQLIDRSLNDAEAEIKLTAHENSIFLATQRATISARLVDGRFPRWQDVLVDRPGATQIDVTVGPFYAGLRQAAIVATDDTRGIDFAFSPGNLVITSATAQVGDSRVEMPINYEGEERMITLDYRFVGDFLRVLNPEQHFRLGIEDNDRPADFRTDDGYHYVVMPLSREGRR